MTESMKSSKSSNTTTNSKIKQNMQSPVYGRVFLLAKSLLILHIPYGKINPYYEELVSAQNLYEAKNQEALNLKKPVKPDEPGLFNIFAKKEYNKKLQEFYLAEARYETTKSNFYKEMKQILEDCRLKYFVE